jgi:crotonobetainyl-CoA:carnitine CoA-transferase CaiB-like acyl-CoA transferase
MNSKPGPLDGLIVLDLTRALAGPYCTMTLGDLGAEIWKAEDPTRGDDSRGYLPIMDGESGYFASFNRNKKSFLCDLRTPEGRDRIRALAARADVLVENFTPGTMDRWGLGAETLRETRPELIYCSISGFGQGEGPRPAFDIIAQALGGLMALNGHPQTPPTRLGSSLGDIGAGLFAANAICAALYRRSVTGRGDRIDVAMTDSVFALLENAVARAQWEPEPPTRRGSTHPSAAPYDAYPASDGWIVLGCATRPTWERLCNAMGRPDMIGDPRFADNAARVANLEALTGAIAAWTGTRTEREAVALLTEAGVPAAPVAGIDELLDDPRLIARDMLVETTLANGRTLRLPGCPMRFTETGSGIRLRPPLVGEQDEEIPRE